MTYNFGFGTAGDGTMIPNGFESGDVQADFVSTLYAVPAATIDATPARQLGGARCAALNMSAAANNAAWPLGYDRNIGGGYTAFPGRSATDPKTPCIAIFSAGVSRTGSQTAEIGLLTDGTQLAHRYAAIDTGGGIKIYNKLGALRGATASGQISTTTARPVAIIFDGLTLPTVWVSIVVAGAEVAAFDTQNTWTEFFDTTAVLSVGEYLPPAYSPNTTLYVDDVVLETSYTASDAPHLNAYPALRISGGATTPATAEGFYTAWANQTDGGSCTLAATKMAAISETPHDGGCHYVTSTVASDKQTFTYSAANPIPAGALGVRTAVLKGVTALRGASKVPMGWLLRLGGVDSPTGSAGTQTTAYLGGAYVPARPGGGSWALADAAPGVVEFGCGNVNAGAVDYGANTTQMFGPEWLWWTALLPLTSTPSVSPVTQGPGDADGTNARREYVPDPLSGVRSRGGFMAAMRRADRDVRRVAGA